jgi:ABC-type antimicrobial peptide transport system permease subunit
MREFIFIIKNIVKLRRGVIIALIVSTGIGVGSIVLLFSLLETTSNWTSKNIIALGAKRIELHSVFISEKTNELTQINPEEVFRLPKVCSNIKEATFHLSGDVETEMDVVLLKNNRKISGVWSIAIGPNYDKVMGVTLKEGRWLRWDQNDKECLISEKLKQCLGAKLGERVIYYKENLKIVGILKIPPVLLLKFPRLKDTLFLPLKIKELLIKREKEELEEKFKEEVNLFIAGDFFLQANNVEKGIKEVKRYFEHRYGKDAEAIEMSKDDFLLYELRRRERLLTTIFLLIGGIALLAAGINILLSFLSFISKRKFEIGIKRACGARRIDIFKEFLLEVSGIVTLGAILGLIFGIIFSFLILKEPVISFEIIFLSVGLMLLNCLLFSLYPALRASLLPPGVAIRYYG